jgi:hypothetical protein
MIGTKKSFVNFDHGEDNTGRDGGEDRGAHRRTPPDDPRQTIDNAQMATTTRAGCRR